MEQLDERAREAWAAYRRLHRLVDAEIARDLERDSGMSTADYDVLAAVSVLASEEHCVRVSQLAARMEWAHGRLSRQLSRMEQRGLVARERCELDGRGDDVLLSEAGRQAYERVTPGHEASIRRHFADLLTPEQLGSLAGIEKTITSRLAERGRAVRTEGPRAARAASR